MRGIGRFLIIIIELLQGEVIAVPTVRFDLFESRDDEIAKIQDVQLPNPCSTETLYSVGYPDHLSFSMRVYTICGSCIRVFSSRCICVPITKIERYRMIEDAV